MFTARTHHLNCFALALCFIFIFAGIAGAEAKDQLYLKGESSPKNGIVRKETPNKLIWQRVDSQGNPLDTKEYDWSKVNRIKYGNVPDPYSRAQKLYRERKNLSQAVKLLDQMMKKGKARSLFIQKAAYLKGKILYHHASSREQYEQAFKALDEATKRFPRYRDWTDAMKQAISIAMDLGQKQKALEKVNEMVKRGGDRAESQAAYLRGKIAADQGDCEEAMDQFKDATDSEDPAIENKARLGLGNCHMENGDLTRARTQYESILSGSQKGLTKSARAGAHNGLGRILFQTEYKKNAESEEAKKKNVKILKEALLHFLRGVIQYTPESGGDSTETQRSLYWAAKSFAELSLNETKAEKKSKYQKEARKIVNTLLQNYPNTQFREKAQKLKRKIQP